MRREPLLFHGMSHYPKRSAGTILDGTFGPTGATGGAGGAGGAGSAGGQGTSGPTGPGGPLNAANIFFGTSSEVFALTSDFQPTWSSVITDSNYTLNGDTVTINTTGLYWVSISITVRNTNATPANQEITSVTFGEEITTDPLDNPFISRDGGCDGEEGMLYLIDGIFSLTASQDVGVLVGTSFGGGAMTCDGGAAIHTFLMEFIR